MTDKRFIRLEEPLGSPIIEKLEEIQKLTGIKTDAGAMRYCVLEAYKKLREENSEEIPSKI